MRAASSSGGGGVRAAVAANAARASQESTLCGSPDSAPASIMGASSTATALLSGGRSELIIQAFRALNKDGSGYMKAVEMFPFACQTGFEGTQAEWQDEYLGMCADWGVDPASGVSMELFAHLVDDTSDFGCHTTDTELRNIIFMSQFVAGDIIAAQRTLPMAGYSSQAAYSRSDADVVAATPDGHVTSGNTVEFDHEDFLMYVRAITDEVSRGHDEIRQAMLDFMELQGRSLADGQEASSSFSPFDVKNPKSGWVERITIQIIIRRVNGRFLVTHRSACSTVVDFADAQTVPVGSADSDRCRTASALDSKEWDRAKREALSVAGDDGSEDRSGTAVALNWAEQRSRPPPFPQETLPSNQFPPSQLTAPSSAPPALACNFSNTLGATMPKETDEEKEEQVEESRQTEHVDADQPHRIAEQATELELRQNPEQEQVQKAERESEQLRFLTEQESALRHHAEEEQRQKASAEEAEELRRKAAELEMRRKLEQEKLRNAEDEAEQARLLAEQESHQAEKERRRRAEEEEEAEKMRRSAAELELRRELDQEQLWKAEDEAEQARLIAEELAMRRKLEDEEQERRKAEKAEADRRAQEAVEEAKRKFEKWQAQLTVDVEQRPIHQNLEAEQGRRVDAKTEKLRDAADVLEKQPKLDDEGRGGEEHQIAAAEERKLKSEKRKSESRLARQKARDDELKSALDGNVFVNEEASQPKQEESKEEKQRREAEQRKQALLDNYRREHEARQKAAIAARQQKHMKRDMKRNWDKKYEARLAAEEEMHLSEEDEQISDAKNTARQVEDEDANRRFRAVQMRDDYLLKKAEAEARLKAERDMELRARQLAGNSDDEPLSPMTEDPMLNTTFEDDGVDKLFLSFYFALNGDRIAELRLRPDVTVKTMAGLIAVAAERTRRAAFPCLPLLSFQDRRLEPSDTLHSAGLYDGACIVADMYPAIVTASTDSTAKIWNAEFGTCEKDLLGHTDVVHAAAFGPDGRFIVTASEDQTAKLWLAVTGEVWRTLRGHTDGVYSAAFSPDGKLVATASGDHTGRIWNVKNGTCMHVLEGHTAPVFTATFTLGGASVVTASRDCTLKEWNARTGVLDRTMPKAQDPIYSSSFSPDGRFTVTAQGERTAKIMHVKTGELRLVLEGHAGVVVAASYGPAACPIMNPNSNKKGSTASKKQQKGTKPVLMGLPGAKRSAFGSSMRLMGQEEAVAAAH